MSIEATETSDVTAESLLAAAAQSADPAVVEETTEEIPPAKEEPKAEPVDKFAPKFAALSRQEKALKQREKALAAREAAIAAKEKPAEAAPATPQEPLELRLKRDTFGTLKELGLSAETLVQMMLNDGKPTQELQMQLLKEEVSRSSKSEMQTLQDKLAAIEKKEQERETQREEAEQAKLIGGFKSQIKDFIAKDLEAYDLIATEDDYGIDLVYDVIAKDAQAKQEEQGEEFDPETIMSIKEAATQVEEQLLGEAKKRIDRSKKVKGLFSPTAPTQPTTPQKKASVTLSNGQSQVQGTTKAAQSDSDRLAAAIALISRKAE